MAMYKKKFIAVLILLAIFGGTKYAYNNAHINKSFRPVVPAKQCVAPLLCDDGFIRNCVTNEVIAIAYQTNQTVDLQQSKHNFHKEDSISRQESFKKIFSNRALGGEKDEHFDGPIASGPGSTLHFTQEMIAILHTVINEIKRHHKLNRVSLLDVPCGDMQWMSRFLRTRNDIDYTGIDIVPALIDSHRKKFASSPSMTFVHADLAEHGINHTTPKYNLILSRHMLMHLPFSAVISTLGRISDLGRVSDIPSYFLATSFMNEPQNKEVDVTAQYRYRPLNLEIPPHSLTSPLCLALDGQPEMYIGLWKLPLRQVSGCEVKKFTVKEMRSDFFRCEVFHSA